MALTRHDANRRYSELETEGSSWKPTWMDVGAYIDPNRGFFDETPNWGKKIDHKTFLDETPQLAARTMAAGLMAGLTSPSRPWFKLGMADPDLNKYKPVKIWLEDVQQRMMWMFARANIYIILGTLFEECGVFGTAAAMLLDSFETVIRGETYTIGEYWLGTGADGKVDTFCRRYSRTVGQLVREFGIDNVSADVRVDYQNKKYDRWVKVRHLIQPNFSRKSGYIDAKNKPFASLYWQEGSPTDVEFLRWSGFDSFPVIAPRWETLTTSSIYGRGLGWYALGASKELQKKRKDYLLQESLVGQPPLQVDANVSGDVSNLPGGITKSGGIAPNTGVRAAYQIDPRLQEMANGIESTRERVREIFYNDLFVMIASDTRSNVTALQIAKMHEEKLMLLGPVLERLEGELLDPLIDRSFERGLAAGWFPEPPDEIQGVELKVDYVSMLAQAQQMVGAVAIEETVAFVGSVAAAAPDVLDVLDADEAVTQYATMKGVPPKIIRTPDEIAKIRRARQEAQEQQQAMQNAGAAIQGAKVLSETRVGENSALDATLGILGGGNAG